MSAAMLKFKAVCAVRTDKEAAAELGYPVREIRKVLDANGLCMKLGNRRRLTQSQFEALQKVLTPQCPSKSMNAPRVRATSISEAQSRGFGMKEALELASVQKPKPSGPRLRPNCTNAPSSGQKRSQPLPRPQPCS